MLASQIGAIEIEKMANDSRFGEPSRSGVGQLSPALRSAKNAARRRHVERCQRVDEKLFLRPDGDLGHLGSPRRREGTTSRKVSSLEGVPARKSIVAGRRGIKKKLRAGTERGSIAPRQPRCRSAGLSSPKGSRGCSFFAVHASGVSRRMHIPSTASTAIRRGERTSPEAALRRRDLDLIPMSSTSCSRQQTPASARELKNIVVSCR